MADFSALRAEHRARTRCTNRLTSRLPARGEYEARTIPVMLYLFVVDGLSSWSIRLLRAVVNNADIPSGQWAAGTAPVVAGPADIVE